MLEVERPLRQIERIGKDLRPPIKAPFFAVGLSAAVLAGSITWWLPTSPARVGGDRLKPPASEQAASVTERRIAEFRATTLAPCAADEPPAPRISDAEALFFSEPLIALRTGGPTRSAGSEQQVGEATIGAALPTEWPPKMALPPKAGDTTPAEIAGWLRMAPETSEPTLVTGSISETPKPTPPWRPPAVASAEPRLRTRPIAKAFKPATPSRTACAVPSRDTLIARAVENLRPPHLE